MTSLNRKVKNEQNAIPQILSIYKNKKVLNPRENAQQKYANLKYLHHLSSSALSNESKVSVNSLHLFKKYISGNNQIASSLSFKSLIHYSITQHTLIQQIQSNSLRLYSSLVDNESTLQRQSGFYYESGRTVWKVILIVIVCGLAMGIMGIMVVGICRVQCMGWMMHCGWIIGYLVGIILILLVLVIIYIGVLNSMICHSIDHWSSHKNRGNNKQNVVDMMQYCISGGSNFNSHFNISYPLSPLSTLSSAHHDLSSILNHP